jgi:hypothetical protein
MADRPTGRFPLWGAASKALHFDVGWLGEPPRHTVGRIDKRPYLPGGPD